MSNLSDRLTRIETKLDDLINLRLEDRLTIEKNCAKHADLTQGIHSRVTSLEDSRSAFKGAGRLLAIVGSSTSLVAAVVAIVKTLKHAGGRLP